MLYRFLRKRWGIRNPIENIDPPSSATKPVIPLDDAEIERLLAIELSPQDEALVHALLTTGMRPGELRNLKPESIMEDTIILNGKTGIDRMPIKPEVRDLLLKVSGRDFIFQDQDGTILSKEQVYRIIENIMLRAGVREGKGGARLFRHTFITRVYGATGDPFLVQRLARHASLTMTRHYEHAALDSTIKKYQELDFLPRKRGPAIEEAASPAIGQQEKGAFEDDPFPEDATQIPFEIAPDKDAPTPPYIIREYAYKTFDNLKGRCWRIVGSNGAWWPTTDQPTNYLSFEGAAKRLTLLDISP